MNTTELIARYYADKRNFDDVDLRGQTLQGLELSGCSFRRANMQNVEFGPVRFRQCDFSQSDLRGCTMPRLTIFEDSQLESADMNGALLVNTQFIRATLSNASFSRAQLHGVTFQQCELGRSWFGDSRIDNVTFYGSHLTDAFIGGAVFVDSDLAAVADASLLRFGNTHVVVDWRTVCRSLAAVRLASFLYATGMPDGVITYLISSAKAKASSVWSMFQSTFISYGAPDEAFARRLRDQLHRNGVKTFFFPTDAVPGKKLHEVMRDGVNRFDRVILICSQPSLSRPGVLNEIQEALAREARDGGKSYLIPITLDGFLFEWRHPLAQPLRDRVVADFRAVDTSFQSAPAEAYSASSPYRSEPQALFDVAASPAAGGFNTALRSLLVALNPEEPGA
jgi:hypothetical protein